MTGVLYRFTRTLFSITMFYWGQVSLVFKKGKPFTFGFVQKSEIWFYTFQFLKIYKL